jgi:hypothetical protein
MSKAKKTDDTVSESVIVNNRPILKDPAIAAEEVKQPLLTAPVLPIETFDDKKPAPAAPKSAPKTKPPAKTVTKDAEPAAEDDSHIIQVKRLSIKPLAEAEPPTAETEPQPEAATASSEPAAVQPLLDKPVEETVPAEPEPTPEPEPKDEPELPAEAKPDAAPDPTDQPPKVDLEAEAKQQAEHDAAIQKLVDSKKYFLPINAVEKRRSKRFVAVGVLLSLLLLAAWADIAADAGLISVPGVKPVTHFFSN